MDVDKPLDELVQANRKQRGGRGRRGGGAGAAGGRANVGQRTASTSSSAARQKYSSTVPGQKGGRGGASTLSGAPLAHKIVISNLPEDVAQGQIKDLLVSTVGPIKSINMSYNAQGKSAGIVTVEFKNPEDSTKAYQAYNGRLIDQKRPMKVEIIVDPSRQPPPPLASRLDAPIAAPATNGATRGSGGRGRGGRRGGASGGGRQPREKSKTAAELDAEMEEYVAGNATTA